MLHDFLRGVDHVVGLVAEIETDLALDGLALRPLQKLHEGERRNRLAAAGLADDADGLADRDLEGDAVHALDRARIREEVGVQVVELDRVGGVMHFC